MNRYVLIATVAALCCLIEAKKEVKFAPYFYVQNGVDLVNIKQQTGIQGITLAFALAAGGQCQPGFDAGAIDAPGLTKQFQAFKNAGGQIIVSTGGAAGTYLDNVCGSATNLAAAYKKAIQATGAVGLDLDIEEDINYDTTFQAVKQVQQQTGVTVSITIAADENGLGDRGKKALAAAAKYGVDVDIVNPMAMDFYKSTATYGQSVIKCAEAVKSQMKQYWPSMSDSELYSRLGVTPMIGVNDCCGAVFTLSDAQQLLTYAQQKQIGHIGFWNINRDQSCPGGANTLSATCSGQQQTQYQYAKLFAQFK